MTRQLAEVRKVPTFIEGFDAIAEGGLPEGRITLVAGTAGTGKTVFAAQFLIEAVRQAGEPAVFVSFEEPAVDIRANMGGFGWDLDAWERERLWAFVDVTPRPDDEGPVVGSYDLGGLLARIEHAALRLGAKRVALDSFSTVLARFSDHGVLRQELGRIASALKQMRVTVVITGERTQDYGDVTRTGIEEFVADNVVVLRNVLEGERRRRTIEILKMRGARHQRGEFPLTILPEEGISVVPLSAAHLQYSSSEVRATFGVPELDEMSGGGLFRDSVTLVSGATGTGKTLLTTEFARGGASSGERVLLFAFEESREQLRRNAAGWGVDFQAMEAQDLLRIASEYPERGSPEEHLVRMKALMDEFQPARIAVDSISAIERLTTPRTFREFVLGLTGMLKERGIAGLYTTTTERLLGGTSITDSHISTVTDAIVLLRYLERHGQVLRSITVLKMRGSMHDKSIREFVIDGDGMHILDPLTDVAGILAGLPLDVVKQ